MHALIAFVLVLQTIDQSYSKARAALDSAVTVHGGVTALRATRRFVVQMIGTDYWRNQSRRVAPPYDSEPWTGDLVADMDRARLSWATTSHFPGGFHNAGRLVIDSARAFYVNTKQRVYVMTPGRTLENQRDVLYRMPCLALLDALDNAAGLRWLGPIRLSDGTGVEAITTSTPSGQLTLGLDPSTKELRALLGVVADPVAGDAASEIVLTGYTRTNGVLMPARRVTRVGGETTQIARYASITIGAPAADSLFATPTDVPIFNFAAPPGDTPVRELAPGLWVIRSGGYWSLAVTLGDYVLVVDAPQASPQTISEIATLAAGKPIRYVTVTHHHDDHAGGIRAYMAAGATVVTTPGNRAYFERMARVQSTLQPTGTIAQPVRIETITGKMRRFTEGTRVLELHDIGPSPHADEMIVAWLPTEHVLFQGDQLGVPPNGAILPGGPLETMTYFRDWVRRQGWDVRVLTGAHMPPGTMAQLDEAIERAGGSR